MKKSFLLNVILIFIIMSNVYCSNPNKVYRDTVVIIIDSATKKNNSFDFVLLFFNGNRKTEIFRVKNQDYSIELNFKNDYTDNINKFSLYFLEDLPTGQNKAIFFNRRDKAFYITDWYDDGGGEFLLFWLVDFMKLKVKVVSVNLNKCGNIREITLHKLY